MLAEINEIKTLRKRHNLTQSQLANLSGVSQSLIAKVEAGILDPSYSNYRKIIDFLNGLGEKNEAKAGDVASSKIIKVGKNSFLTEGIKLMKQHGISQLPVVESNNIIGLLAETDVIESIHKQQNVKKLRVSDVMEEAPPTVPEKTPLRLVTELLRVSPLIVVTDKGRPKGIITKSDVLNKLAK
jgi:predicted transcriptional regulator